MLGTLLLAAVLGVPASAPAGDAPTWRERILAARAVADRREGRIAFAVVDERGRLRAGRSSGARFNSASVVKAMLLVAYLNHRSVRGRKLRDADSALLSAMVRRSGNRAGTRVRNFVGNDALVVIARRAGMHNFATAPSWGSTQVTAADLARLFFRIDRLTVRRHRDAARRLLQTVVSSQRWGIPRVAPAGSTVAFKGGWRRSAGGRLVNQAALVERGGQRIAIAVLTDGSRSHGYGVGTIERIARALLTP